jgi:hypothetical protein
MFCAAYANKWSSSFLPVNERNHPGGCMSDYKVDFLPQADRNAAVAQELQQNQN